MFVWTVGFDMSFGLRIRQHSLWKRTLPMPTFLKPSYYDLGFYLMQVLGSTCIHLLHGLYANVTLNLCLMPYSEPIKDYVIWYMGRLRRRLWSCLLRCGYIYLMPCSSCCYLLIDIAWFKVQRKNGFLYDILVYWIAAHWSDLFNS